MTDPDGQVTADDRVSRRSPIPEPVRRRIVAELNEPADPPRSKAAIAREHGVSMSSVQRIADRVGAPKDHWRTDTIRAATTAALDRRRDARSRLADRLLTEAERALGRMTGPFLVYSFGGKENEYNQHILDRAPSSDLRNLMQTANIAITRSQEIDRGDATVDDDRAGDALERLFGGLGAAYELLRDRPAPDDAPIDDVPQEGP